MTDQLQTDDRSEASAQTTAESAANARRRRQAIGGALAGVAVILVLVGVFVGIKVSDNGKPSTPAAAAPAPSATAPADQQQPQQPPTDQPAQPDPQQPAAVATPPALAKRPAITAGGAKRLTKLKVTSLVQGTGPKLKTGQTATVNYILATYADGKVIQATWDSGQAVPLQIGGLIPGFDQGIIGVPVGSRVQLDIPSKLAYGDQPANGAPAGDLRFIVDVLAAQ